MLNQKQLDEIINQLLNTIPSSLNTVKADLDKTFRTILQTAFSRLDLVTREEFDAQVGVLKRTREKLEQLEEQLKAIETQKTNQ